MDQKHREYCIRLGNPYMKEEIFNEKFRKNNNMQLDSSWISENKLPQENWQKNNNNM